MKKTSVISLLVSAAVLGLCGCASDQSAKTQEPAQPKPAKDTRPREERLKVGMSQDEVIQAVGKPRGKSVNSDGSAVWTYNDWEKAAFIPYYSMGGGKTHFITVMFDTAGKVKSWSTSESGGY